MCAKIINKIDTEVSQMIKFGTGGWRAVIGSDFIESKGETD